MFIPQSTLDKLQIKRPIPEPQTFSADNLVVIARGRESHDSVVCRRIATFEGTRPPELLGGSLTTSGKRFGQWVYDNTPGGFARGVMDRLILCFKDSKW